MSDIVAKVRELSEINTQISALTEKKKALEAYFFEQGGNDVIDTKYKSVTYADPDSQAAVMYTESQKLSIDAPNYLKQALGDVFDDVFAVKMKPDIKPLNTEIERMLIGIFTNGYVKITPDEVIKKLPCSDKQKAALAKKLKGANFATDRNHLMKIGELSETDASDYAYLYAEAVVWQTFCRVAEMCNTDHNQLIKNINLAVSVSDSTKLTVT